MLMQSECLCFTESALDVWRCDPSNLFPLKGTEQPHVILTLHSLQTWKTVHYASVRDVNLRLQPDTTRCDPVRCFVAKRHILALLLFHTRETKRTLAEWRHVTRLSPDLLKICCNCEKSQAPRNIARIYIKGFSPVKSWRDWFIGQGREKKNKSALLVYFERCRSYKPAPVLNCRASKKCKGRRVW